MEFKQTSDNVFELSFKVGDKLKCETSTTKDAILEIMAYVDGFVMWRIGSCHPTVSLVNDFKKKLIELNCKI